jgi:hypothetical protein
MASSRWTDGRPLKTIGHDVGVYRGNGNGQYLYDREGTRSRSIEGFGVLVIGRNHLTLRAALKSVINSELPNLVQIRWPSRPRCHLVAWEMGRPWRAST